MKKYSKSAIILLAALALIGCSKAEEFQYDPDSALQIESVSGISPFALMQEPASKAVITGETLPGDEATKGIGLFVTAQGGGAYDDKSEGYSNVKYNFNGEKWSTQAPIYLSNTTGKLYGYFPYSETAANLKAVPVASSLNSTDYLYATSQDVSFSNKSVNLTMNHALARLHLTIKKGDKYLSDCNLTKIVLQSKSIDANGTMDITTGAVTATKAADATGTFILTGTDAVTAAGITKDILLVPANSVEGKKDLILTLTIDGVDAEVKFTADKGLDIRSGIQCNATLTIEDTGIKVTGVGVGVWDDGGSQTVQLNGHTVTVKLDEVVVPNDILTDIHIEGQSVIIKATSIQKSSLSCNVGDDAQCQKVKDNDIYTFTISEFSSNVEAVLSYSKVTIKVSWNSNGKAWIGDDESKTSGQFYSGQQVVIHAAPNDNFRLFRWNDNNRETSRTFTVIGEDDAEYSASFISSDLIPGLFTVNSKGKQVFFSKGNLWCSTDSNNPQASDFHFETNQYDTTPSSDGDRVPDHISHFFWYDEAGHATALQYNISRPGGPSFFAGKDFKVNGVNTWCTLTGGSGNTGEWKYLIERKDAEGNALYKLGVKVCGSANCLILLPDDWKWGENGVGSGWLSEYSESTTVKWSTMENAGAVCLPAAGKRNGYDGDKCVGEVGSGYYWSSYLKDSSRGYCLSFTSRYVYQADDSYRYLAFAVRLVTEYQSEPSAE